MKNTEKIITWMTDNEWSRTLGMLLGLDDDPYSYDDIIDNLWPFKTNNKRKENEYVQFSTYSIRLLYLRKYLIQEVFFKNYLLIPMMRPSHGIIFTINFTRMQIYYNFYLIFIFFVGTHERLAWIYSGLWCSRTKV
jgi:hypothetical protein